MKPSFAELDEARAAEERGELAKAGELFEEAGEPEEAARVTILRADASGDTAERLVLYAKAEAMVPPACPIAADARKKRALTAVRLGATVPLTRALRSELARAAEELEANGELQHAADAYAYVGDLGARARVLAQAGAVDALESVLSEDLTRRRDARSVQDAEADFAELVQSGNRRDALGLAAHRDDPRLRENARAIASRRGRDRGLRATLHGQEIRVVLGEEVVIGRAPESNSDEREGSIIVPSAALSRRHVAIFRRDGGVFVRELGSRNGTAIGPKPLDREASVGEAIELRLGHAVSLVVEATGGFPGL